MNKKVKWIMFVLLAILISLPLIWNILFSLRFEGVFQKGKIWQTRCAYVLATIILSHFVAIAVSTFVNNINALF